MLSGSGIDRFLRGIGHVFGGDNRQARIGQNLLTDFHIGAFKPHHQRHGQLHFARGLYHALAQSPSHFMMPPKIFTRMASSLGFFSISLNSLGHLIRAGAAANVEEIRRITTVQFDNIHGRHRQTRAVYQTADIAVEAGYYDKSCSDASISTGSSSSRSRSSVISG